MGQAYICSRVCKTEQQSDHLIVVRIIAKLNISMLNTFNIQKMQL